MLKTQETKLGLLTLLRASHTIRGRGEIQIFARAGLLDRMVSWARRR
jgi:hypothetical protein